MFDRCDFIVGQDGSMVIVLPGKLPMDASSFTVSASPGTMRIRADYNEIAAFPFNNADVFDRLAHVSQVGIVEFPPDDVFPGCITNVAYVETRLAP